MATNTTVIDVDRTAVFAVLADGWSYSNWVTGTSHMRAVQAHWPAAGSKLFHASGLWPAITCDETQVEQVIDNELMVLTARARPAGEARVRIELDAQSAAQTRVTMTEYPVSGPGRWLHSPINDALIHRRNTETLHRLRRIAERRTAP